MKATLEVFGPPHQYKNIEVGSLPTAGQEITLESWNRGPVRFYVHCVDKKTVPPTISTTINENGWSPYELSQQLGTNSQL
jgi:hypothetical protein